MVNKRSKQKNRLSDIITEEVSVVDRAANKKRFLVIKQDSESGDEMAKEEKTEVEDTFVAKSSIVISLENVQSKNEIIKSYIDGAVEEGDELSESTITNLQSMQILLKGISSPSKVDYVVLKSAESITGNIPVGTKKSIQDILTEVDTRLEKSISDCEGSEILDVAQISKIDSISDLVGSIINLDSKAVSKISSVSVSEENKPSIIKSISKSIKSLVGLQLALSTNVSKSEETTPNNSVIDVLVEASDNIDSVVNTIDNDQENVISRIFNASKVLKKAFKGNAQKVDEVLKSIGEDLVAVSKASSMYKVRWFDKPTVVLATSDEKVAEFETWDEAEMDALSRNIELVVKSVEKTIQQDSSEKTDSEDTSEPESKEVDKMSKLAKLKTSVKKLKTAVTGLSEGKEESLEEFSEAAKSIGVLVKDFSIQKGVNLQRGIADNRGLTPDNPNAGSGVQPDTSVIADSDAIAGEGAESLNAVLKNQKELEERLNKQDKVIASLRSENTSLKKSRAAPSTFEDDDFVTTSKSSEEKEHWPSDMADWSPDV